MLPGMLAAPHPMVAGTDEQSYYRGEVSGATEGQAAWVREHRPDAAPDGSVPAGSASDRPSARPSAASRRRDPAGGRR